MADLATFFNNPGSLSDGDLNKVRRKLALQRFMPVVPAVVVSTLVGNRFARHPYSLSITISATLMSYLVGARYLSYFTYSFEGSTYDHYDADLDQEISDAFQNKYI